MQEKERRKNDRTLVSSVDSEIVLEMTIDPRMYNFLGKDNHCTG